MTTKYRVLPNGHVLCKMYYVTMTYNSKTDPLGYLNYCINCINFFELGRHKWFALRRIITNSRSSAFTGSFLKLFLKETSQEDGKNKNWTMQRLLHVTLRLRYSPTGEQIQNGRTADEIPRDPITPWCGPPLFCPCFSLSETSVLKIS